MVAVPHPPPPVVTIVDPSRPAPPGELLHDGGPDAPRRLPRPSRAQAIAGSLVLLLALGTLVAFRAQADRARTARAALAALRSAAFSPEELVTSADGSQLVLSFTLRGVPASSITSVILDRGGDGWQVTRAGHASVPARSDPLDIAFVRDTRCGRPLSVAPSAVATVEVAGKRRRFDLVPPPGFLRSAQSLHRQLCGELNAAEGLFVIVQAATRRGPHLSFDVTLVNGSIYPARLLHLSSDGLVVTTGTRLPLALPARPVGPRARAPKPGVDPRPAVVRVELTLRSCRTLGQELLNSLDGELDLVVGIDGHGGASAFNLRVPGLEPLVRELCGSDGR